MGSISPSCHTKMCQMKWWKRKNHGKIARCSPFFATNPPKKFLWENGQHFRRLCTQEYVRWSDGKESRNIMTKFPLMFLQFVSITPKNYLRKMGQHSPSFHTKMCQMASWNNHGKRTNLPTSPFLIEFLSRKNSSLSLKQTTQRNSPSKKVAFPLSFLTKICRVEWWKKIRGKNWQNFPLFWYNLCQPPTQKILPKMGSIS